MVLTPIGTRYLARVYATRSFRGRAVTLQRLRGGAWADVEADRAREALGEGVRYRNVPHGTRLRLVLPPAPGYLRGVSRTVAVP